MRYIIDPDLLNEILRDRERIPDGVVDLSPVSAIIEELLGAMPRDEGYARAAAPLLTARIASRLMSATDPMERACVSLAAAIIVVALARQLNTACQYDTPGDAVLRIFSALWRKRLAEDVKSVPYYEGRAGTPQDGALILDLAACPTLCGPLVTEFYAPEGRDAPEDGGLRHPADFGAEVGEITFIDIRELDFGPTPKDYEDSNWPNWDENFEPPVDGGGCT
jgi:hypothetical protein